MARFTPLRASGVRTQPTAVAEQLTLTRSGARCTHADVDDRNDPQALSKNGETMFALNA